MDDTVSRREAIEALKRAEALARAFGYHVVIETVRELPSTQTELIRCMDCDWWLKQPNSAQGRCALFGIYPTGSWYCANARKRGDA